MLKIDKQRKYWDKIASVYEEFYRLQTPKMQKLVQLKAKIIIDTAQLSKEQNILELGCGTGIYTQIFAGACASITASDLSEKMIERAMCQNKALNVNVKFLSLDAQRLSVKFKPHSFDAVVGTYILQYLDIDILLEEICYVLKPHGQIAFIESNGYNPYILQMIARRKGFSNRSNRPVLPFLVKRKLDNHKFEKIKISTVPQTYWCSISINAKRRVS